MTQAEAAAALGISTRTLRRRIAAGELQTRRDGKQTLIELDLPDGRDAMSDLGEKMVHISTAGLVHQAKQAEQTRDVLAVMADYRLELQDQTRRARWSAWAGWTATAAILSLVVLAAWRYHQVRLGHHQDVAQLEHAVAERQGRLSATAQQLERAQQTVGGLQDRLAIVSADLSVTVSDLAKVIIQRDGLAAELAEDRQTAETVGGLWSRLWRSLASSRSNPQKQPAL